jgi:hypothetical protein
MIDPLSAFHWSPSIHFPWSGGVMQHIDPELNWFSRWITPGAGNPGVEEKAFTEVASYGKQLGLITDVLLALVQQAGLVAEPDAVQELHRIRDRIAQFKSLDTTLSNDKIVALVADVRKRGGAELLELASQLAPLLTAPKPDET